MYDGQRYTVERLYGGSTRRKINDLYYSSDKEARLVLTDDVSWRAVNVPDRYIRSAQDEPLSCQELPSG